MRAFVALELDGALRPALDALVSRLRRADVRASWVRPENMHCTLRFLGEIPEETAGLLSVKLAPELADLAPLRLTMRGVGAFPRVARPSVVWVGLTCIEGNLPAVQAAVEAAARSAGVAPETKAFRPHVTLARIRDPRQTGALAERIAAEADFAAGEFPVASVTLFQSELAAQGPRYTRIREFPLSHAPRQH